MSRPVIIYYLFALYVLVSFLWWTYLMLDSNNEILQARRELIELKNSSELAYRKSRIDFYKSKNYEELRAKYNRRIWMIAGEGTVFVFLLFIGIWKIRQSISKEVALANQQKNFLLSITHELKSPISSIKLALQTLFKRELDKEKSERLINNALSDSERLHALVENILLAAKIDNRTFHIIPENFDFSSFVKELISKIPEQKQSGKIILKQDIQEGIFINGDKMLLGSVLNNLIENAIKYSDGDAEIIVSLKKNKDNIILEVADNGIGISDDDKEKVFEKFYRIGNEETRKTTGTGLGLYIVKEIVNAHHGSISIRNNHPKGTVFTVRVPPENDFAKK